MEDNNNTNNSNEIKKSPYEGINNPQIRMQYEKEFNKPNYSLMVSLFLIFISSVIYVFLISDTFQTIKEDKVQDESIDINDISQEKIKFDDLDNIDINSLVVIDKTNKVSTENVIKANYIIEDLDYNASSFEVPYINIKSNDATLVNEEIKSNYRIWAKESAKYQKTYANTSLDFSQIVKVKYYVLNYDDILSVVISFSKRENSIESYEYYAYSFNLSTTELLFKTNDDVINGTAESQESYGKKLSYQELLAKLNLSYEQIDMAYKEILTSYSGEYGEAKYVDDTINLYTSKKEDGSLNAFIDEEGKINIISKIYTPLYENGTFRIFAYNGAKFESVTNLNIEPVKETTPDITNILNFN